MATNIEFEDAEDIIPMVARLIEMESDVKFSHLFPNLFVYRRRVSNKPARWIARIGKVPTRFRDKLNKAEYILEVDGITFNKLSTEQQEAVLYHELCHTFRNTKDKYTLVRHDIEEFSDVVRKYGGYLPDVVTFINAVKKNPKLAQQ